jgi:F-type H+-transporting ATPase subunit alpha
VEPDGGALAALTRETFAAIGRAIGAQRADLTPVEIGTVTRVTSGIARVRGLPGARAEELLRFRGGALGIAADLEPGGIGVILLGDSSGLRAGDDVRRTGRVIDVPVGPALLGRVVDAVGRPLDDGGPVEAAERRPIERDAPAILDRAPVEVPLQTGLKVVDALIPVGRGQRELVVGDRQTGKTAVAVEAILSQRAGDVISVYCAIGQRASSVARVVADLRDRGALRRAIVVVAGGDEVPGLQFVAPYAATAMAEFFMEQGRDTLVVYDDLTRHARAYRELSLLLRRPPGREAYPGDIFYVHARLLERATRLRPERGGGSLTALPIVETQAQNLAAYIPTNLISITDGQIYLSPDLFQKGQLPAVDVGRSVSRVGGKAQLPAYRSVAGELRLSYAQFEELERFSRFGTRLDPDTRARLERGRRVREVLRQPQHEPLGVAEQIAVLLAATEGLLDPLDVEAIAGAEARVRAAVRDELPALAGAIDDGAALDERARRQLVETARAAIRGGGA